MQAKINASLACVPMMALPKNFVGTIHPITAAIIAGRNT